MGVASARALLVLMQRIVIYMTEEEKAQIAKVIEGAICRLEKESEVKGD